MNSGTAHQNPRATAAPTHSSLVIAAALVLVLVLLVALNIAHVHVTVAVAAGAAGAATAGVSLLVLVVFGLGDIGKNLRLVPDLEHVAQPHLRGVVDDELIRGVGAGKRPTLACVAHDHLAARHAVAVGVHHGALGVRCGGREEVEAVALGSGDVVDLHVSCLLCDRINMLLQRWMICRRGILRQTELLLRDRDTGVDDGLRETELLARQLLTQGNLAEQHQAHAVVARRVAPGLGVGIRKVQAVPEGGTSLGCTRRLDAQSA
mmetsp:Transcript_101640/g.258438  ORF Transcript_101640/g.258438 Transcript_101640/m.258438 type:complete len:263 (-) Transcript_101640:1540-2328(-)